MSSWRGGAVVVSSSASLAILDPGAPGGATTPPPGAPHHPPRAAGRRRDTIRPVVFGYVRAPLTAPGARSPSASLWRTAIARFAIREGLTLAQVFVDTRAQPPWTALDSLLEASRFTTIAAVVIPDRTHLGNDPNDQHACRQSIEHETGGRVISIHPTRPD